MSYTMGNKNYMSYMMGYKNYMNYRMENKIYKMSQMKMDEIENEYFMLKNFKELQVLHIYI